MMSGRQGPIYMCYDAGLQEAELDHDVPLPPHGAVRVPAAPAPDPAALANAADALAAAERPVVIADFAARPPHGWAHVIAIAETLGAPVWDCNSRLNFPSNHPLNLSMAPKECYDGTDVVLALDIADFEGPTHVRDIATRTVVNMVPETATWIDIGFTDVEVSKWSMDYGRTFHAHHRMTADPVIGMTQLVALLQERIGRNADLAGKIAARAAETGTPATRCWREVDSNHRSPARDCRRSERFAQRSWGEVRMSFGETGGAMSPPSREDSAFLPKSVFDRPGSDRWNLASTTFPDAGPMVRIRFPPAESRAATVLGTISRDGISPRPPRKLRIGRSLWARLLRAQSARDQDGPRCAQGRRFHRNSAAKGKSDRRDIAGGALRQRGSIRRSSERGKHRLGELRERPSRQGRYGVCAVPSNLISCSHSGPSGGWSTSLASCGLTPESATSSGSS